MFIIFQCLLFSVFTVRYVYSSLCLQFSFSALLSISFLFPSNLSAPPYSMPSSPSSPSRASSPPRASSPSSPSRASSPSRIPSPSRASSPPSRSILSHLSAFFRPAKVRIFLQLCKPCPFVLAFFRNYPLFTTATASQWRLLTINCFAVNSPPLAHPIRHSTPYSPPTNRPPIQPIAYSVQHIFSLTHFNKPTVHTPPLAVQRSVP